MIQPSQIVRCNRKTLAIFITKKGEVVVKAPFGLPEGEIYKFICDKENWILSKLSKITKTNDINSDLFDYSCVLLFGKRYKTEFTNRVKSVYFSKDGVCEVPDSDNLGVSVHKIVLKLKSYANEWLKKRTIEIAEVLGLTFNDFKISNTKGRWGACSSKREINLNYRVVCLEPRLIDYVIVHELCHLNNMNHSPKFWADVAKILPDFKQRRTMVKTMSFLFEVYP